MSTIDDKRAVLGESIKLLSTHDPFLQFMAGLKQLRENAMRDAARLDVLENEHKRDSMLGEIRTYFDIEDLVAEHQGDTS